MRKECCESVVEMDAPTRQKGTKLGGSGTLLTQGEVKRQGVPTRPKDVLQGHERLRTDRKIRGCGQKGEFQSSGFQKQSDSSW